MLSEIGVIDPEHREASTDVAIAREIPAPESKLVASANGRVDRPEIVNH
jgi:hypothetical protein